MNANEQNKGGYDCEFVEDPPDYLKCLICQSVTRDPQQHGYCGTLFCNSCITEYKKISNDCPHCVQPLSTFNDRRSSREVQSLKVRCENLDNSCQWVGKLCSLEEHLLTCDYALLPCTNECKNENGDILKVLNKDLENHLTTECPRRQYSCSHCGEFGEYEERITTHIQTCTKIEVQCPNDHCQVSILHCELARHRSNCDYERVSCKYAEVGCEEKILRKDLEAHEEDDRLHLQITIQTVIKQTREITLLAKQHRNTTPFKFKMINFINNVQEDYTFYSPPFYTSVNGYKMCIRVDAKGNGIAKDTHVSVFGHLMKGENDDSLTWPFTGRVKIDLLNQLEDKNHYNSIMSPFPADRDMVSGKVVEGERGRGWGISKFIAHADLDYKRFKNCQYLRDDTLFFRVTVLLPDYKSWLDCQV